MITYRKLGRMGRLGNSLFQVASTIAIAQQRQEEVIFPADWIYRPYFSIPDEMFGEIPEDAIESSSLAGHLDDRNKPWLQDVRIFKSILDPEIKRYFRPSEKALQIALPYITQLPWPCVGMHVRRGDLVEDHRLSDVREFYVLPSVEYYNKARATFPTDSLFIASDDVEWCRRQWPEAMFGPGQSQPRDDEPGWNREPTDWIDLFMLSHCNHLVISGSTFGIWGALLSDLAPHNIIRTDKVYGPELHYVDGELLFDPAWKVMPYE